MWSPVDLPAPSEHFVARIQTQQSTTPKSKGFLIPLSWRTLDSRSTLSGAADVRTGSQVTYAKVIKRNTGLSFSPSTGLWISGLFNEETVAARNVPETGTHSVSGVNEEFILREALVRAGFDLTSSVTMGVALRGQSIKGDVLGSFGAQGTDRSIYTGRRMGVAAAAEFTHQSFKAVFRYEAPVTGKVNIGGESKVSSEAGYLGGAVNFSQSASFQIRGLYGVYEFSKNELGTSLRGPNQSRQFNFSPLGLSVDARVVPLSVMGIGIQSGLSSQARIEADLTQGKLYHVSDPDMLPPQTVGDSEKIPMYSARIGLILDKTDWESQVFFDYGTFRGSRTSGQSKLENNAVHWGVGLRTGIEIQ
jgi:hypothetical protein